VVDRGPSKREHKGTWRDNSLLPLSWHTSHESIAAAPLGVWWDIGMWFILYRKILADWIENRALGV
jgi:hypothetical protein